MKRSAYILAGVLVCLAASLYAQRSAYVEYQTTDGLAQSQVRAVAQDADGYLWLGTLGGLSRFDGYGFVNFSRNEGLPDNQINCLLRHGPRMLVGSTGALTYIENGQIKNHPFPKGLEAARVISLAADHQGAIWLGLDGDGLLRWSDETYFHFSEKEGLPDTYIRALAVDREGVVWAGTRSGLLRIAGDTLTPTGWNELDEASVSDLLWTQDDGLWVATFNRGVYHLKDGVIKGFTEADGLISNDIRCLADHEDGRVWFGSARGLSAYVNGQLTTISEREGLPYANIKSLGRDREGHLWIGTDGKGLIRKAGSAFSTYSVREGLHSDIAMGMAAAPDGAVYIGSYDQGIQVLRGNEFAPYAHNDVLPNPTIWQLEISSKGVLWAGTSMGLYRESGGQVAVWTAEDGLPGNRITALAMKNGAVWVGAENGFARFTEDGILAEVYDATTGFAGRRVRSILPVEDGLWLAAQGQVVKWVDGAPTYYPVDERLETAVYCLAGEANGRLWVGTSDGLYALHSGSDSLQPVDFSTNFSARNINFLGVLDDESLVIGTNNGLYRLDLAAFDESEEVAVKQYTAYEGLQSNETNQNALLIAGDELWFGTTQGAVRFLPYADTAMPRAAPKVHISGVQLFLQEENWLLPATANGELPELSHNENYLTFHFTGIHLSNPGKIKYRYRLVGADTDWLGTTRSRTATYAYLPHGTYTFEVEAFTDDDPDLVAGAAYSFAIAAPFYLSTWFILMVVTLVVGLVYLIVTARVRQEREKRSTLMLQYQSRMQALESQSLNSSMNRHFIFNALNSIQYYINMQDRVSANRYLTSFAKLIRKNLDSSQENQTLLKDELERVELYLELEKMRFQGRFDYELKVASEINLEAVQVPAMMLQPFLENSIWHGILPAETEGRLDLDIRRDQGHYVITIEDNGIGYETSLRSKQNRTNGHVSKGMEITQNRIALFGQMTGLNYEVLGPTEISKADGKVAGTRVTILIPISEKNQNQFKSYAHWEN